jgi:hypothetical protein
VPATAVIPPPAVKPVETIPAPLPKTDTPPAENKKISPEG